MLLLLLPLLPLLLLLGTEKNKPMEEIGMHGGSTVESEEEKEDEVRGLRELTPAARRGASHKPPGELGSRSITRSSSSSTSSSILSAFIPLAPGLSLSVSRVRLRVGRASEPALSGLYPAPARTYVKAKLRNLRGGYTAPPERDPIDSVSCFWLFSVVRSSSTRF